MSQQSKFYEESAVNQRGKIESRYFKIFQIVSIIFFIIAAFWAIFSFSTVPSMVEAYQKGDYNGLSLAMSLIFWFGALLTFVLIGVVFWRMKRRFNVSFDYTFVEDELRITQVFNGRKRKFLTTLQADQILKIGYYDSQAYQDTLAGLAGKKPKYLTPNQEPAEDKEFIFILATSSLEKNLYVIECRKILLEYLVRAAGITKFVRK